MGRLARTFAKLVGLSHPAGRFNALDNQRLDRARNLFIKARYDAAVTNDENRRHWANVDYLSADAAATPDVRRTLRARSRYEAANNSYSRGIVKVLANACIGTGPRLQLLTDDAKTNLAVNREWARWSRAIGLAEKLRTMRAAKVVDGEAFAVLTTNSALAGPVLLDVRLVEADRVTAMLSQSFDPDAQLADGIEFDADGNPTRYQILVKHPGSPASAGFQQGAWRMYDAASVIHIFNVDRPGQIRGLPELMAALPLFSQLRRYTLATLSAAEIAATFSAVLKTTAPAANGPDEQFQSDGTMDSFDIERGMMTSLPYDSEMQQFKAEQPTTTYPGFKREIVSEAGCGVSTPYAIAASDSSNHNFSSANLDRQGFDLAITIERNLFECCVLDRIFDVFLKELALSGAADVPVGLVGQDYLRKEWRWDGRDHIDPSKAADAERTQLETNTTTLASVYAKKGLDWEEQLRQRARELALMRQLDIPISSAATALEPAPQDEEVPVD